MRASIGAGLVVVAALSCAKDPEGPPVTPWKPGTAFGTPRESTVRGLLDRRGLIHAHSVYSYDACDGEPEKDGVRDPACFEDFRRDLCTSRHDFVMLTDHRDGFSRSEFPDVLLHKTERGDRLVERGGSPTASWAACPDGSSALILAGAESGTMPVGLEGHAEGRGDLYGQDTPEAIAILKAKGAVVLLPHTEAHSPERLITLPIDGFEMFNLHANTFLNGDKALALLNRLDDPGLRHPDLMPLGLISEDPVYLSTWGTVLARGARRVTTMGTDCHRNSFPQLMADGERVDSYRRMMMWFSNHLLLKPEADGSWDDRHLKEALRAGRLYGAFELLGYPEGFDYRADSAKGTTELGAEVLLADAPTLLLKRPSIRALDPARTPPTFRTRILKAKEGGWDEVAAGEGDLSFRPTAPGAYRAEVRMVPHHLREELHDDAEDQLASDVVWIYANPIYVR